MINEADQYSLFLKLARQYGKNMNLSKKWENLLQFETCLIKSLGKK